MLAADRLGGTQLGKFRRLQKCLAEIVHNIDPKDSKFARKEIPGIDRFIAGIAIAHREDEARLTRAAALMTCTSTLSELECRERDPVKYLMNTRC
jgi:hypothetical protein